MQQRRFISRVAVAAGFFAAAGVDVVRQTVAYVAGKRDRTDADWNPTLIGPNAMAEQDLMPARAKVSWLIDNDEHFRNFVRTIANNVAGTVPEPATPSSDLNEWLEGRFRSFCTGVDPARQFSLLEHQRLFLTEMCRHGETLVVESIAPGMPVPMGPARAAPAVELIASPRVPMELGTGIVETRAPNGNRVRQGVELDAFDRPVAYWVLGEHPADGGMGMFTGGLAGLGSVGFDKCTRVGVERSRLAFVSWNTGQLRGVPEGTVAVKTKRREGRYLNAQMLLAEAAASIGLYFKGGATGDVVAPAARSATRGSGAGAGTGSQGGAYDGTGQTITRMTPGLVGFLKKDVEPALLQANLPGPSLAPTQELMLRRMAAGVGISYAVLSRDYSKGNFSQTRAESLEDRKGYAPLMAFVWNKHTLPLYRLWLRWMIATGQIPERIVSEAEVSETGEVRAPRVIDLWTPRMAELYAQDPELILAAEPIHAGWEWVNPAQESTALETELRNGIISPQQACAGKGRRLKDVYRQRIAAELSWNEMRRQAGLAPAPMPGSGAAVASGAGGGGTPVMPADDAEDEVVDPNDQSDQSDQSDQGDQNAKNNQAA